MGFTYFFLSFFGSCIWPDFGFAFGLSLDSLIFSSLRMGFSRVGGAGSGLEVEGSFLSPMLIALPRSSASVRELSPSWV